MGDKEQFIADLYPAARRVSQETGMSWELILAQAALETGWGERMLPGTNNVFNIKADGSWDGPSRSFNVREHVNGRWVNLDQDFRVYGSYDEALRDRMDFLRDNPRYARAGLFDEGVRGNLEAEAQALQRAGYATDPQYAQQLAQVFNGPTMQRALALAREQEQARGEGQESAGARTGAGDAAQDAPARQAASPAVSITDAAHPNHALFADVSRRVEEQTGRAPSPEAAANLTLQMLENGIRSPEEIRGLAVSGSNVHVQGATPGNRVTVDLDAPTATLPAMSEHMARQTREREAQEQAQQRSQPPGTVLA